MIHVASVRTMWKSIAESIHFTALRLCDICFGTNLFAPVIVAHHAKGRVARLPNAFLDGFSGLPSIAMERIFSNISGEEIFNIQMVCKRWMALIKSHQSRYARKSIAEITISFNNGIRYIAQSTNVQSGECLDVLRIKRSHRNLASLLPRLTAEHLELRIHNIDNQFEDLHLSSINTQAIDIKFCRPVGNALTSHVECLFSELARNRSVKKVCLSFEVAQREATLPKNIVQMFESNNIQLSLNI